MRGLFVSILVFSALAANAYLPPVDTRAGVKVEVGSFPQKIERPGTFAYAWPLGVTEVNAGAPRSFPVTLENTTDKPITGRLEVWMNDDWTVAGEQGTIMLAPKEKKELSFTATAKLSALNALYPVHARFTPSGVKKTTEAPHPIAVFMYKNPNAPRSVSKPGVSISKVSARTTPPTEAVWQARETQAIASAKAALTEGTDATARRWCLAAAGDRPYGAAVVLGERGLIDGALAFTDGERSVVYRGFTVDVKTEDGLDAPEAKADIREEKGTLRIKWSLPGVARSARGFPRIDRIAIGPSSEKIFRIYAGIGNVIENPKKFSLAAGGFALATRHVGADYANGISIVQAVDVPPDCLECDGDKRQFALVAHHDALFTFVPSSKGSFAAARRFRAVSGYKKSPGRDKLGSRMCLDEWSGDYARAAKNIELAKKYGLTDSIFVKHDWQCWGYDYRLPEIYPPRGDVAAFGQMRDACRDAGILFVPHDNYTDIYPDAENYSYDLVVFNLDGTPQKAWFNPGRHALSYRWAPHAFHPWCLRNAKLLKGGFDPDGIFIDVFTAHPPFDYLDRKGNFHTKIDTSANWAKGFELYRQGFDRTDAVCVSEAGQDHLVGCADAGQSDHFGAAKLVGAKNFGDSERTPWHDIVTHNYYVLFAGGIGGRYQEEAWHKGGDAELHGYASDDYLSNAIIGGRNPMCDGPFTRNAVKTYWLQHDACAELGAAEFLDLQYGPNIHCQRAFFSDGGEVWVNRQTNAVWKLPNGVTLPSYGYYAKTRGTESGIVEKGGVRCAYAKSKNLAFYDARKPSQVRSHAAISSVLRTEHVSSNHIRLIVSWEICRALKGYRGFVHVCNPNTRKDGIVFQCDSGLTKEMLETPGVYEVPIDVRVPNGLKAGAYTVRYGVYNPNGPGAGGRLLIGGGQSDLNRRVCAGRITVKKTGDKVSSVVWAPDVTKEEQAARDRLLGINRSGVAVDFGGVKTDGSFRFAFGDAKVWTITPLPDTDAFTAEIDLGAFGGVGRKVVGVETMDPEDGSSSPKWSQNGAKLTLSVDAQAFAYRILFE